MYPLTDPYFAGLLAPYGTQAMVSTFACNWIEDAYFLVCPSHLQFSI